MSLKLDKFFRAEPRAKRPATIEEEEKGALAGRDALPEARARTLISEVLPATGAAELEAESLESEAARDEACDEACDDSPGAAAGRPADDARDAQLIAAFLAGDPTAMDRLAAIYLPQVARYSHAILRDEDLAADAAQETFARVIQSAVRFHQTRSFKPWLFTLARRSCLDIKRQAARRAASLRAGAELAAGFQAGFLSEMDHDGAERSVVVAIDPTDDARQRLMSREEQRIALALLEEMDEDARSIIVLRLFDDLAFAEIAKIVGRPLSTVTTIYYRRLAKLRSRLEEIQSGQAPAPARTSASFSSIAQAS
jgi:RNA polymerase sigma factor (sigma-70 family)